MTIDSAPDRSARARVVVLVAARDEALRLGATLAALREAFPEAQLLVADDGSTDATAQIARGAGAAVIGEGSPARGKGQAMTAAARHALQLPGERLFVLCDADLGDSARLLAPLAREVGSGRAQVAVAAFTQRRGGGFGVLVACARAGIRRSCGMRARAPLSGQRALSERALRDVLPFARGYGMEVGMTIDAVRAGHRVAEVQLDLFHREHGRTLAGFRHRARQLAGVALALTSRSRARA